MKPPKVKPDLWEASKGELINCIDTLEELLEAQHGLVAKQNDIIKDLLDKLRKYETKKR